jgi:hypothetical protein
MVCADFQRRPLPMDCRNPVLQKHLRRFQSADFWPPMINDINATTLFPTRDEADPAVPPLPNWQARDATKTSVQNMCHIVH